MQIHFCPWVYYNLTEKLTAFRVMELVEESQTLVQSSKYCEFSLKWIFTEEQIEYRIVVHLATLPVCISHCYLIQIWKKQKKHCFMFLFNRTYNMTLLKINIIECEWSIAHAFTKQVYNEHLFVLKQETMVIILFVINNKLYTRLIRVY